ncbi:hypothetical protein WJX72_011689 [[Myrmecia] bisecta]|uniref:Uncharacterized protein n=1 Tax=[Myrmecia] bisecta TaxID=41462 RepID=A0AAW1P230_9CHLO
MSARLSGICMNKPLNDGVVGLKFMHQGPDWAKVPPAYKWPEDEDKLLPSPTAPFHMDHDCYVSLHWPSGNLNQAVDEMTHGYVRTGAAKAAMKKLRPERRRPDDMLMLSQA